MGLQVQNHEGQTRATEEKLQEVEVSEAPQRWDVQLVTHKGPA